MPEGLVEQSLVKLTRDLVRIPSRAGLDSCGPVFARIVDWLRARGIAAEILFDGDMPLVALASVGEASAGPTYLLIATADTAEFGDQSLWTFDAVSGEIREGWLYGRGSGDSKSGISVFCHVAAALVAENRDLGGAVTLVFDAEEHSGAFLGIKRALTSLVPGRNIAGAMIGYPGQDKIVTGCRGFLRAGIRVHGKAAHSGASTRHGINAVTRAAALAQRLQETPLPQESTPRFPLPPQLTVTAMHGGSGDSIVPDLCVVRVDIRLTLVFDATAAEGLVRDAAAWLDQQEPCTLPTEVMIEPGWPAYAVPPDHPMVEALWESARQVLNREVPRAVAGPTSVGNLLALHGIPATAGFGAVYRNVHATDESILIDSLEPVYQTYLATVRRLLRG